ncbi:hypothetical protein OXX69_007154 [Metschnikowia pulcherrima]
MRGFITVQCLTLSLILCANTNAWQNDYDHTSHITTESLIELFGLNPNQTGLETKNEIDTTPDLGHQLEKFIQELLSFVSENAFANEEFDAAAVSLDKQLMRFVEVMDSDSDTYFSSKEIWHEFSFAKYAFRIMVESSENMKRFNYLGWPEEHLINYMSELRARLLVFFDTNGLPNKKYKKFSFKMNHYAGLTSFLVQSFDELTSVPIETRLAFKTQTEKVRDMLLRLEPKLVN